MSVVNLAASASFLQNWMLDLSRQAVSAGYIQNSSVNNLYKWENVLQTELPRKWKLYYVVSFFICETI